MVEDLSASAESMAQGGGLYLYTCYARGGGAQPPYAHALAVELNLSLTLSSNELGHGPRRYSHGPAVRRLRPMLKFRV